MEFSEIWSKYPKKLGKRRAERYFNSTVKTEQDFKDINTALDRYIKYLLDHNVEPQYIKHGSTWFNEWEDWVDYEDPKLVKKSKEEIYTDEFNQNWKKWEEEAQQAEAEEARRKAMEEYKGLHSS